MKSNKYFYLILTHVLFLNLVDCARISNSNEEPQIQKIDLVSAVDKKLNNGGTAIKNKKTDTVFVFNPVDSIRWIDSVRLVIKDSINLIPQDTLIVCLKDSLVYNYIDTIIYNYRDSVKVSYDERTFPEETIERYLNLFFKTENVNDTAGLHFNFSVYNGKELNYVRDSVYEVPDSINGWRVDWWREDCKITKLPVSAKASPGRQD